MKLLVAQVLIAGLILGAVAHEAHVQKIDTKDIKPGDRDRLLTKISGHGEESVHGGHKAEHHAGGHEGLNCPNKQNKQGESAPVTVESWVQFLQKHAEKIIGFVSSKNWNAFAQWLSSASQQPDFPVKSCGKQTGGRSGYIVIRLVGITQDDLETVMKQNQDSKTGGDGWWILLTRLGTKGQPKEKQEETGKKVIQIVTKNQDEIRKHIKEGNWKLVIELLQKNSKEKGVDIDWDKVLSEQNPNGKSLRKILEHWATIKPQESKQMDLGSWLKPKPKPGQKPEHPEKGGQHGRGPRPSKPGNKETGPKPGEHKQTDKPHDEGPHPHGPHPGSKAGDLTPRPGHPRDGEPGKDGPGKISHKPSEKPGHGPGHRPGKPEREGPDSKPHKTTDKPHGNGPHPHHDGTNKPGDERPGQTQPGHPGTQKPGGITIGGGRPGHPVTQKPGGIKVDHHPGHPGTEKPGQHGSITSGGSQPGKPNKPGQSHPEHPGTQKPGEHGGITIGGNKPGQSHSEHPGTQKTGQHGGITIGGGRPGHPATQKPGVGGGFTIGGGEPGHPQKPGDEAKKPQSGHPGTEKPGQHDSSGGNQPGKPNKPGQSHPGHPGTQKPGANGGIRIGGNRPGHPATQRPGGMKIDHHPGSGHPGTEKPGVNGEITVGGNQSGHPHKPGHGPKKPHGSHPSRPHPKPEKEKEHTIQQIVKQTGTNEKDLHQAVEQNQNSKSGADGWFILITQQAGAPKSPETTKKITKIIDSNQDQIKEKVKSGDWEGLIILLKQQSDEQGVDIDWEKVLGDSKNSSFWKMILLKWANTPQQEVHSLDVDNWVTGDSDLAASRANSIILIIRENQEEVQKMVQEGRTDELQQFLEQKAQEKGIDADWQDLDFSNPQSEGGQWFQIIRTNADKQPQELKPDQFYKDISEQFDGGEGMGSLSDFTNGFRSGFWQTLGSGSGSGGLSSLFGSLGRGGGKSETGGFLSNLGLGGGSSGGQGGMLGGMLGGGGSQSGGQGGGKGSSYSWSSSSGDQGSGEGGSSGGLLGGLGGGSGGSGGSGLLGRFGLGK